MSVLDAVTERNNQLRREAGRNGLDLAFEPGRERRPWAISRCNIANWPRLADLMHRNDVGMVESAGRPSLAKEPPADLGSDQDLGPWHLQRDLAAKRRVKGLVDDSEPPLPKGREDLEPAQPQQGSGASCVLPIVQSLPPGMSQTLQDVDVARQVVRWQRVDGLGQPMLAGISALRQGRIDLQQLSQESVVQW